MLQAVPKPMVDWFWRIDVKCQHLLSQSPHSLAGVWQSGDKFVWIPIPCAAMGVMQSEQ